MMDAGRHPNITLLSYSEVEEVSGYVGNFEVQVRRKPRYVLEDRCTACGACPEVCPIAVPDKFNEGLGTHPAIYRSFPQAIPPAYVIDKQGVAPCRDACPVKVITIVNNTRKHAHIDRKHCIRCYCCHEMCPYDAIELQQGVLYRLFNR